MTFTKKAKHFFCHYGSENNKNNFYEMWDFVSSPWMLMTQRCTTRFIHLFVATRYKVSSAGRRTTLIVCNMFIQTEDLVCEQRDAKRTSLSCVLVARVIYSCATFGVCCFSVVSAFASGVEKDPTLQCRACLLQLVCLKIWIIIHWEHHFDIVSHRA